MTVWFICQTKNVPNMAQRGQHFPKHIDNNPLATQIDSYGLCWGGKKAQNGLPGCPLLCSNLVSYLPTQNRPSKPKCVAKRQFQPIWATFWPPWGHNWDILGLANGPNWSAWMSSMPFQPGSSIVLLNRWSHLALIVKMPVLALFGP